MSVRSRSFPMAEYPRGLENGKSGMKPVDLLTSMTVNCTLGIPGPAPDNNAPTTPDNSQAPDTSSTTPDNSQTTAPGGTECDPQNRCN